MVMYKKEQEENAVFEKKRKALLTVMEENCKEDAAVAFSGGADSSLLLKIACDCAKKQGKNVYAMTIQTELHTLEDLHIAEKVAKETGSFHEVLYVNELEEAGIEMNPVNRCYLCKKLLFTKIRERALQLGVSRIMEGTNADDLTVYRPGIQAIRELGIRSPLAEAEMTKAEVRRLAAEYGISVAERPAAPCMATRFPYGTRLDEEKMKAAKLGEDYIRSLGFYNVRLRVQDNLARIEVDEDSLEQVLMHREGITEHLKKLGYQYVALDLEGFRSGSMDESHNKKGGRKDDDCRSEQKV